MNHNKKKTDQWIWWAMPTEKLGDREHSNIPDFKKTCVTPITREFLINNASDKWQQILKLIKNSLQQNHKQTLDKFDFNRARHFLWTI